MTTTTEPALTGQDMMRTALHWEECVDGLQKEITDKQGQLEQAQRNAAICRQALDLCREMVNEPNPAYGLHGHIRPVDLDGCRTQMEAAHEIARRSDGRIRLAHAAPLMFDTGKWKAADSNSLKRSLHGQLNMSDEWEKQGERTGIYRLLTFTSDIDTESPLWPEKSSPTDDGGGLRRISQDDGAPVVGRVLITG